MCHVSFRPDFAISPLYFSLRLYERQSVKPARLNGCPGSFERKYYLLCSATVLWKNFEPFLKNITSNLVVSCQLLTRFRHITSLFLASFVWTPVCQTSAAKWLPRLIWKEILSTLCRVSIVRKFRAVFEKYDIEDNLLLYVLGYILYLRLFSFNDICKCLGSCCASFYVAFDKDTFYFVAPKLYVVIWRGRRFWGGHRFFEGATGGLGGHRWPLTNKDIPIYIYIYIYIIIMVISKIFLLGYLMLRCF